MYLDVKKKKETNDDNTPWKINMEPHLDRKMIFQTSMTMVHVSLPGCIHLFKSISKPVNRKRRIHRRPKKFPVSPQLVAEEYALLPSFAKDLLGKPKKTGRGKKEWPGKKG